MPGENTLNYTEQGGSNTVIGGTLTIATGGRIVPNSGTAPAAITPATVAAASPTKAEFDALVGKFNALLAACQGAGVSQ